MSDWGSFVWFANCSEQFERCMREGGGRQTGLWMRMKTHWKWEHCTQDEQGIKGTKLISISPPHPRSTDCESKKWTWMVNEFWPGLWCPVMTSCLAGRNRRCGLTGLIWHPYRRSRHACWRSWLRFALCKWNRQIQYWERCFSLTNSWGERTWGEWNGRSWCWWSAFWWQVHLCYLIRDALAGLVRLLLHLSWWEWVRFIFNHR